MNIEDLPGDPAGVAGGHMSSSSKLMSRKHPESPPDAESETTKTNVKSERSTHHGKSNQ